MSFATFSGPVRAGTVKEGPNDNTGVVVLSQTATIGLTTTTAFILPAGSQIHNINIDVATTYTTGATLSVGNASSATAFSAAITTPAVGRQALTLTATHIANWRNIGSADVPVIVTLAGTTATAGAAYITILYSQKLADGSSNPPYTG